jgi:hypothetical protein
LIDTLPSKSLARYFPEELQMTNSNHEYKKMYAAMIREQYPSLPNDASAITAWVFGDKDITEELWEIEKAKLSYQVGYYGLQQHTQFCALLAKGMTKQEAFLEVREEFLKLYRDWMETPEFLRGREINAKNHEKWLLRQQRRAGVLRSSQQGSPR